MHTTDIIRILELRAASDDAAGKRLDAKNMRAAAEAVLHTTEQAQRLICQGEVIERLQDENERLRANLAAADAALIEARDTLCGHPVEDDDAYWAWFNAHEDAVFTRITREAKSSVKSTTGDDHAG